MKPKILFRVAPWKTMFVPTQKDADSLIQAICDKRTALSRERRALGIRRTRVGYGCVRPITN